jgi:glycosyltransferase involved in cell wall biosynthesis
MASIVHIDTSRTWRGGQLQVFLLHRELLRLGVESRLLARAGSPLQRRCEEASLPVQPVPLMRPWYPPAITAVWRRTRRAKIVHAHDSHAATLAAIVRTINPSLAVVCHRRVAFGPKARFAKRWKYRHIDRWIAVSAEIAGKLRRAGASDARVVPSAVDVDDLREQAAERSAKDLRSELGIDASAPVIGLVGALAAQKGHKALVAAAPRILQAVPEAVFLCVGEGRLSGRLQRRVRRDGLGRAFRFTGFRRDVAALMSLCTIIIAPSIDGEGSSAVIKEAMVLGAPVVASDLPGNLEVLNGAGVAVPTADDRALAENVVALLADSVRRAELGAGGLKRSEIWVPSAMATGVLAAYEGLGRTAGQRSEAV